MVLKLQKNLLLHNKDYKKLQHGFARGNLGLSKEMLGRTLQVAVMKGKVIKREKDDFSYKIYSELRETPHHTVQEMRK